MFIIEILVPIFLLVWSIASFLAYLYTRYLIDKYDRAVLPGCRIKAQKYQWSSKQVWEDSFTLLSGLWLKFFCIFAPHNSKTYFLCLLTVKDILYTKSLKLIYILLKIMSL